MARLSGKDKQAETVLTQVKDTLRDSLLFYVRHVAAREAAQLLRANSPAWMGLNPGKPFEPIRKPCEASGPISKLA